MSNFRRVAATLVWTALFTLGLYVPAYSAESPFRLTVECPRNPKCIFTGKDIPVSIRIWNTSNSDIFLTTEYMQEMGPYAILRDSKTGDEWYGHNKLGNDELLSNYTLIPPGQSTAIRYKLFSEEITIFTKSNKNVDIRVEFEFFAKWRRANGERQNFGDKASVAIKGKNFQNGQ